MIPMPYFTARVFLVVGLLITMPGFAQSAAVKLFTIDSKGWQRSTTPSKAVYTCSTCDVRLQVQIDVGSPLGKDSKFRTNKQFLESLGTAQQQKEFARDLLKTQIPLASDNNIRVERTGVIKIGGQDAFQFIAVVDSMPKSTRDTTMLLIYKGRLVKVSVNYFDGTLTSKSEDALRSLLASLKFV
jgi:hypothetical protein